MPRSTPDVIASVLGFKRRLLYLALLFALPCWAQAPSMVAILSTPPTPFTGPTLSTHCLGAGGSSASNVSCTISGFVTGTKAVVFGIYGGTTGQFTAFRDCTGSFSNAGASTCVVPSGTASAICMQYIPTSATVASGTVTFTLTFSATVSFPTIYASSWSGGVSVSNYIDTSGTGGNTSSTPPSAVTSGNVSASNEVGIGAVADGVVPITGSGFTQLDISGGGQHEYKSNPTSGSALTCGWTNTGGSASTWTAGCMVIK